MAKLAIAGCKHTTRDLIESLVERGFKVENVITVGPEKAADQKIAGYMDLRPFLKEKGISYYLVNKYSLKSPEDQENIKKMRLDVLFCMGWQRLIPEWFLEELRIGAFGMHGSNKPLPHGRGRSPMNWSLIQNKKIFFTHLFKYKAGVDDGEVVGYQLFDITPYDTAHTLHFKNLISMVKLCERYLPAILINDFQTYAQKDVKASYYPKRTADDGVIFWEDSTEDIYNLIRAVTHPFPGAFSFLPKKDQKIIIWHAIPFDTHLRWDDAEPGEVCEILYDGSFIVKTGDTSLLVVEYEGIMANQIIKGMRLHYSNFKRKTYPDLPQ